MAAVINVNGRIASDREAVIPVLDHGFLYGEGVYEVVRTYGKRPFLLDRHLQRMRRSAEMIALPVPFSDEEFRARLDETLSAFYGHPANHDAGDVYVRWLLTRGVGEIGYDPQLCPDPSLVIIVKPVAVHPPEIYEHGVRVVMVSILRNHPGALNPAIKSNNLMNNALAAQEAYRRGAFDGILRNYRGEISECSIANLFVIKDGVVRTPPNESGLLAGITRGFVEELGDLTGIPFERRVLVDADVFGADEAFLTSTTQEIVPIVQVDDRPIGNGKPGPITTRLLDAYRARVQEICGTSAPA
jgi:branched-chain amino acid aminotransferase